MWFAILGLMFGGCGGNSSSQTKSAVLADDTLYVASLPDGFQMSIDLDREKDGTYEGDYEVEDPGVDEDHAGGFLSGTIEGTTVHLTCLANNGATFTLDGTVKPNNVLSLTRSDVGGAALEFAPITRPLPATRATRNFTFGCGESGDAKSVASIDTAPTYVFASGAKQYKGTWLGFPVEFTTFTDGKAYITVQIPYQQMRTNNFVCALEDLGVKTSKGLLGSMLVLYPKNTVITTLRYGQTGINTYLIAP
ncbi:hypothetical protein [Fimbriimonas ginsengisoli]|uniref:hypothetical protein n=1 Tax=Fimbriimonas ginsengisoli TaxID=1005039 RepID=UPI00046CB801|nr:hypothetical protein [Fimbriimonas ginsengisoli]